MAGFPVVRFATTFGGVSELLVITKDGRLPIVPVTLADRLDREANFLAKRLEEVRRKLTDKTQASVEPQHLQTQAELRRQVEALRAYRASFAAQELCAAWIEADPQGPEGRALEARIRAFEALSPEDQTQVNALGARARLLQRQAQTRIVGSIRGAPEVT